MDRHPHEQYEGSWWLPQSPDRRVGGVLELGAAHQLKVFGDLAEDMRLAETSVIHGECLNRTVTLFDCDPRGGTSVLGRDSVANYFSPTALIGHYAVPPKSPHFDIMSCELSHLSTWTARSGIRTRLHDPPAATYTFPSELTAQCDGFTLTLSTLFKELPVGRTLNWSETERFYAHMRHRVSLNTLTHAAVRPLQHMLSLAAGRICDTERLQVADSARRGSHGKLWFDVVHYKGKDGAEFPRDAKSHEFLFTLADITFDDFMPKWFDLITRVGLSSDILFSLGRKGNDYVSNRLFNVVSAAEGMHRRLHPELEEQSDKSRARIKRLADQVNDRDDRTWLKQQLAFSHLPTFAERLNQLVDRAGPTFTPYHGSRTQWVRIIKDMRNMVAHTRDDVERNPSAMFRLASTLDLLLRIVLLREAGFSHEFCEDRVSSHPQWSYLRRVLPDEVPVIFSERA